MASTKEEKILECDYLVVGAGASPLTFVDTLLTELPETKIILVDKKGVPGGHWVDAYGYVKLHQPSVVYGIASKQLEGNWLKVMLTRFMLPWKHRANKQEILTYFGGFVNERIASKQIEYYPNSVYNFEVENNDSSPSETKDHTIHSFSSLDGSVSYKVKVNEKLIDGTFHECIIPHDAPLQFPVDKEVRVMTPNQVFDAYEGESNESSSMLENKYVVLGAGKTGMDCIVYLQRTMKVHPDNITWVISKDVWMMDSESNATPYDWPYFLAKFDGDMEKAASALEKKGHFVRLDKDHTPSVFKFPRIYPDELKLLRNVKSVIRRGRVTAIRCKSGDQVTVEFEKNENGPWNAFAPIQKCIFVHAASPGPFNDADVDLSIFKSKSKIKLQIIFAPPISFSMSVLAKFEAARRKGTLDLAFMRKLVVALEEEESKEDELTENDLLNKLILPLTLDNMYRPLMTQSIIFATLDEDPMVPYNWTKQNRLSLLSIPGMKSRACDNIRMLCSEEKDLVESENYKKMLRLVGEKIKPLEGK